MAFFEVNADTGVSASEYGEFMNMTDKVMIPDNIKFKSINQGARPIRSYPTNGFQLNVEIWYDFLFHYEFSASGIKSK